MRKRATDEINYAEWRIGNPIFTSNVATFDAVLRSLQHVPSDYYVNRFEEDGETTENYLARVIFPSDHMNPQRVYKIHGPVGSGKSEMMHFLGRSYLPRKLKAFFYVNINCYQRLSGDGSDFDTLTSRLKESIIGLLLDDERFPFTNRIEIGKSIYKYVYGVSTRAQNAAIEAIRDCSLKDLLGFFLHSESRDGKPKLLISVDNIDECSRLAMAAAIAFALKVADYINDYAEKANTNKTFARVVIPMREYTAKTTNTETYPNKMLPDLNLELLAIRRLEMLASELRKHDLQVHQPSVVDAESTGKATYRVRQQYMGVKVTVSGKTAADIVDAIVRRLSVQVADNSSKKLSFKTLVRQISGRNAKTVIQNLYYFLHSCKISIFARNDDIWRYSLTSSGSREAAQIESQFFDAALHGPMLYDCLMAIHVPFFDYKASLLPRLFGLDSSTAECDERSTLCCGRILGYIYNRKEVKFGDLVKFFLDHGYDEGSHIKHSLQVLLNGSLVNTDVGIEVDHLDNDVKLRCTESGAFYLNDVMSDKRYVSYLFDHVYMDEDLFSSINARYSIGKVEIVKREFTAFTNSIIEFMQREEERERVRVDQLGLDYSIWCSSTFRRYHGKPESWYACFNSAWYS